MTDPANAGIPPIEVETAPNPAYAVIFMHGLGADGNDFVPVVRELGLSGQGATGQGANLPGVRFIFPHAPRIPVTWNNGMVMRAWYDISSVDGSTRQADDNGIRASCRTVRELIAVENARGIPTSHIVLGGFSQGGAMAYSAGLTHPESLAGIISLSAYVPSPSLIAADISAANRTTPIFAAHGLDDPVLPLHLGEQARDLAAGYGNPVDWHTYPMAHSVCTEEIAALGQWLRQRFQAVTS
jgi:phospholipase/carboxylesterase